MSLAIKYCSSTINDQAKLGIPLKQDYKYFLGEIFNLLLDEDFIPDVVRYYRRTNSALKDIMTSSLEMH